jgi:hypothetical protein
MLDLRLLIFSGMALSPIIFTFAAAFLLHDALKTSQVSWHKITMSVFLLVVVLGAIIVLPTRGLGLLVLTELPLILLATGAASFFLTLTLARWRKLAGMLFAFSFSAAVILSFWISLGPLPD